VYFCPGMLVLILKEKRILSVGEEEKRNRKTTTGRKQKPWVLCTSYYA
jgi:hypothetical protein